MFAAGSHTVPVLIASAVHALLIISLSITPRQLQERGENVTFELIQVDETRRPDETPSPAAESPAVTATTFAAPPDEPVVAPEEGDPPDSSDAPPPSMAPAQDANAVYDDAETEKPPERVPARAAAIVEPRPKDHTASAAIIQSVARPAPRPIAFRHRSTASAKQQFAPAAASPSPGESPSFHAMPGLKEALTGRIRFAVQAAVQCPAAARMMGQSGKASVGFDYRNGAVVGQLQLGQSSGLPLLDSAALSAVHRAHYPEPPPEFQNQVLHLLVWIEESCGG